MPMPGRQGRPIEGGSLIRRALASSLQDPLCDGVVALPARHAGNAWARRWARDEISPPADGRVVLLATRRCRARLWGLVVTFGTTPPGHRGPVACTVRSGSPAVYVTPGTAELRGAPCWLLSCLLPVSE